MKKLLWVDVETTGLDPTKDLLLEVAFALTDEDLRIVGQSCWVISHSAEALDRALEGNDFVRKMHRKNGLLRLVTFAGNARPALSQTEDSILRELLQWQESWNALPMAGSNPSFDRRFLSANFPTVHRLFSHRHLDMSSFRCLWPDMGKPAPKRKHRAMADILDDIEQLHMIRGVVGDPEWIDDRLDAAFVAAEEACGDKLCRPSFEAGWEARGR